MTEREWDVCTDLERMLGFLKDKVSGRKMRLFAVACCRRVWDRMADGRSRRAVGVAEAVADGMVGTLLARHAVTEARACDAEAGGAAAWARAAALVFTNPVGAAAAVARAAADRAASTPRAPAWRRAHDSETAALCGLLRDVVGNPFRPLVFDRPWRWWHGGLPFAIARRMYASRDFTDMDVLADTLEEAGFTDRHVLAHCRRGEHVRGCFVVDAILGQ
jgi:hypothetical protein